MQKEVDEVIVERNRLADMLSRGPGGRIVSARRFGRVREELSTLSESQIRAASTIYYACGLTAVCEHLATLLTPPRRWVYIGSRNTERAIEVPGTSCWLPPNVWLSVPSDVQNGISMFFVEHPIQWCDDVELALKVVRRGYIW